MSATAAPAVPGRAAWLRSTGARRLALVAALPAILPVVALSQALVRGRLIAPGDAFNYYLPVHELAKASWRAGEIPGWNPFAFAGQPLLATAQAGVFYPLNALFLVLPSFEANNVLVLLHLAIAATGAALLARRLTGDDAAAVVAGLAFGSCGFFYGHLGHQTIEASAAWLPWAFLAYERLRERGGGANVLLTSGVLAMPGLAGQLQMFAMTILALATYAVVNEVLAVPARARRFHKVVLAVAAVAAVELVLPTPTPVLAAVLLLDLLFVLALLSLVAQKVLDRSLPPLRATPRSLRLLGLAATAALGLAAVQLVPTALGVGQSLRGSFSYAAATSFSSSATHLPLLLFPYLFGNQFPTAPFSAPYQGHWNLEELAGYPGLACVVLAAAGMGRIRRDRRAVALGAAAGLMLLISLGRSTGLGFLVWLVPPFGHFRAWARYVVVVDLAVAILAAYGVAELRAGARRGACRRAAITAGVLVGLGVVVPLLPPVARHVPSDFSAVLAVALPLVAALAAAATCFLFGRNLRIATAICILLVPLDGFVSFDGFFGWRHSPSFAAARAAYSPSRPAPWGYVPDSPGGIDRYLFVGGSVRGVFPFLPQLTDLKGMRSASGYDPLASTRYLEAVGGMQLTGAVSRPGQFLRRRSPLLDLLRISLVLVPVRQAPARTPPWLERTGVAGGLVRYRYRPRVRDAFLVGRAVLASGDETRAALDGRRPFDPGATALVERPTAAAAGGQVAHVRWRTNRVEARVVAAGRSLLVLSQAWAPGWSARIDSRRAPVLRVDGILSGVEVPRGAHRVRLEYRAPGLQAGLGTSLSTLLALLVATVLSASSVYRNIGGQARRIAHRIPMCSR